MALTSRCIEFGNIKYGGQEYSANEASILTLCVYSTGILVLVGGIHSKQSTNPIHLFPIYRPVVSVVAVSRTEWQEPLRAHRCRTQTRPS